MTDQLLKNQYDVGKPVRAGFYTITLELELDATNAEEARKTEIAIADDLICWPAVMSVKGDVPRD